MTEKAKAERKKTEAPSQAEMAAPPAPAVASAEKPDVAASSLAHDKRPVDPEAADAQASKGGVKLEGKMAEFVDWIETISVLDLSKLVKALEQRLGVSASAPVTMVAGGAGGASQGDNRPAAEAQTEFMVVLTDFGAQKIQVIKEVRVITGLGLKESKELVEGVPKAVKEGVSKEEAAKLKEKLEAVGAKVEIK